MPRFGLVVRVCSSMSIAAIIISAGIIGAANAAAGEYVISQKKRKFTPTVLVAKVGDKVVFLNDDRFAHNLFSKT